MENKKYWTIAGLLFLISAFEGFFYLGIVVFQPFTKVNQELFWSPSLKLRLVIFAISLSLSIIGLLALFRSPIIVKIFNLIRQVEGKFHKIRFLSMLVLAIMYLIIVTQIQSKYGFDNNGIKNYFNFLSTWLNLVLLQALIFVVWIKGKETKSKLSLRYLFVLGILFFVWLVVVLSGIGLIPDDRYWNVAGVPVLAIEVVSILTITLLLDSFLSWFEKKTKFAAKHNFPWVNLILCLVLWLLATILWINAPFGHSFFAPGPYPPNNDFHPYSDAAIMDLGGQYMLIGEGLNYPFVTEKTLYVFFLGLIHLVAGQNYLSSTALQIGIFAIFPVLMFLLGKKFGGRFLGLFIALFAIIKERNAIISTFKISVSNSRLYLTEFPTAIWMVALAILLFYWFRNPHKRPHVIVITGGVLGFSSMVRTNPLVLIPIILFFALFVYHFQWKKWFLACTFFMLGFLMVVSPWLIFDQITEGTNYYYSKIDAVVSSRLIDSPIKNISGKTFFDKESTILNFSPSQKGPPVQIPENEDTDRTNIFDFGKIFASHFFNNEIKALFILPFQSYPQDLNILISEVYWKEPVEWKGFLPLDAVAAFALNLGLLALGITFAWSNWRLSGMVPLLINIGYYLSNALARTSGSRYLLPVDWTIYFYYCAGIAFLIQQIILHKPTQHDQISSANVEISPGPKSQFSSILISFIVLLMLGSALPIINISFPKRYGNLTNQEIINKLNETDITNTTGVGIATISNFINNEGGLILYGRGLYPRYLESGFEDRSGLLFDLISPELNDIFIPMDYVPKEYIVAGKDYIVVGCQRENYIEGFFVNIDDQNSTIIQSTGLDIENMKCN